MLTFRWWRYAYHRLLSVDRFAMNHRDKWSQATMPVGNDNITPQWYTRTRRCHSFSALHCPSFSRQKMAHLGVNIDHVATIRQARRTYEPDPVHAAAFALLGGADVITIHLREDRRHIQDRDLRLLRETVPSGLNLELACELEIVHIACEVRPDQATLVPERREEVTTEGGLDVVGDPERVRRAVETLHGVHIPVSLFIDPDLGQVEKSAELGVAAVELHTGSYLRWLKVKTSCVS